MLRITRKLKVQQVGQANVTKQSIHLLDIYFECFLNEVQLLLHQGLIKQYYKETGNVKSLKGKLEFASHVQKNLVHKERFYTTHQVYEKDHLIHQILGQALDIIASLSKGNYLYSKCKTIQLDFPEVKYIKSNENTFTKIPKSRKTAPYEKALAIARLILLNYAPNVSSGSEKMLALLFDMNNLWEEYVLARLKEACCNEDVNIYGQNSKGFWNGITIRPDIVLEHKLDNDKKEVLITLERFTITKNHVTAFIKFKHDTDDFEFADLNLEFVKDFEFYLRSVRKCANNTTLKYIANFKKIVIRAIDKEIIEKDPFKSFKGKKTKIVKKPISAKELAELEQRQFSTDRLNIVRDIFVFQCYTGLAYIDAFQLRKADIKDGVDGNLWILSERQKTNSTARIPLLPKAIKILEKYKDHSLCLKHGTVLPVSSNQKMNEYLKEIAILCGFPFTLNTHMARRTFGSTVTLNNNVPINVVKEMLGHSSVKQTESYAITEQATIGREMTLLDKKLNPGKIDNWLINFSGN